MSYSRVRRGGEWRGEAHHSPTRNGLCTLSTEYWKVMTSLVYEANFNFPEINKKSQLPNHVLCHEQVEVYQISLTQEICTADLRGQETLYSIHILFYVAL